MVIRWLLPVISLTIKFLSFCDYFHVSLLENIQMLVDSLMYFSYIVDKTSINYQSKTTMHFLTWQERFKQKWCTIVTLWRQWLYSHLAEEGGKNAAGWDKMLLNLPADCRGKSRAMRVLLHFSSSFCACRWNLCGHTRTPSCGSSAGHSRREAERRVSSPRGSPGGEASRRQPWVPVQLLPLSGGGQRAGVEAPCDTELSARVWLCLLGGNTQDCYATAYVCNIFM